MRTTLFNKPWGTVLTNQAAITFDVEATINTNEVMNTIGPTRLVYLPAIVRDAP